MGLKSYGSVQRYLGYLKEAGLLDSEWNQRRGLRPLESDVPKDILQIPLLVYCS